MKDLILTTLFGNISLSLSEPDAEGNRSGCIDWSEVSQLQDHDCTAETSAAIDGVESLILAHACAGVDVESDAYIEGINTALEAIDNDDP